VTRNPESVAQITNTSSAFDVSAVRNVGLQVRTVTKSGTNEIHGSLFAQYDERGLNAYQSYGGPNGALPIRVENSNESMPRALAFRSSRTNFSFLPRMRQAEIFIRIMYRDHTMLI
jgi:hypothetical protein